jgi:hypothetical protein
VSARGYRQKFGQPLNNAEDDRVKKVQSVSSSLSANSKGSHSSNFRSTDSS